MESLNDNATITSDVVIGIWKSKEIHSRLITLLPSNPPFCSIFIRYLANTTQTISNWIRSAITQGYQCILSSGWYLDFQIPKLGVNHTLWIDTWKGNTRYNNRSSLFNATAF